MVPELGRTLYIVNSSYRIFNESGILYPRVGLMSNKLFKERAGY